MCMRACVCKEKEEDGGSALVKPFPGDKVMGQPVHAGCCCSFLLVLTSLVGEGLWELIGIRGM